MATLRCKINALHPDAIQGKEGIKFYHLATLGRMQRKEKEAESKVDVGMSESGSLISVLAILF